MSQLFRKVEDQILKLKIRTSQGNDKETSKIGLEGSKRKNLTKKGNHTSIQRENRFVHSQSS